MKKSLLIVCVLVCAVIFSACVREPEAGFSYDLTSMVAQKAIQFTNLSSNATQYEWNFGDGTELVNSINPVHTYERSGSYTVSLTAIGEDGTASYTETIAVARPVSVIPGVALGGFELYEEWSSVKKKLNDGYEHNVYYMSDYDLYYHEIYTVEGDMEIDLIGSAKEFASDDYILFLFGFNEFDGETEKGFGIGDSFSELKSVYGTPDEIDGWSATGYTSYDYDAIGISFIKQTSGSAIINMIVYPSDDKSANSKARVNISARELREIRKAHLIK